MRSNSEDGNFNICKKSAVFAQGVYSQKFKSSIMEDIQAIKPGPKPKKDDGSYDERRRVTPEKKKKYSPPLKPHKHKPKD
jgi:hypothetical protein